MKASTKAEDYAAFQDADDEAGELVDMPSGAVFRLRRADIQGMVLTGELPQSLVNEGLTAWRKKGIAPEAKSTTETETVDVEDTLQSLIFLRQTVVENCLEPRIGYNEVGVVCLLDSQGNAIAKLKKKDFLYAFRWITYQEGVEAGGLSNFRKGQEGRTATVGSNRKKLRRKAVVPA